MMSDKYMSSLPSTCSVDVKYRRGWYVRIIFRHRGLAKVFLRLGYFMTTPENITSSGKCLDCRLLNASPPAVNCCELGDCELPLPEF